MEIKRTQKEEQTSLISVKVGEKDYGEAVEKSLRDYRRKANIPGVRPGILSKSRLVFYGTLPNFL